MEQADNVIMKLIERKMAEDNWTAYTPESYASYLFTLTNEEIVEEITNEQFDSGD